MQAELEQICALFERKGHLQYGEEVTQLEHALQCGMLAEREGAKPALIVAALLHDVGHMLHQDAALAVEQGRDDAHEALGGKALARWFGPEVSEPVRLHVQAKRYLCATQKGYFEQLSPLSVRTLSLQGGPMSSSEAAAFESLPFSQDAAALRRWDDAAKEPGLPTPPLSHFLGLLDRMKTQN